MQYRRPPAGPWKVDRNALPPAGFHVEPPQTKNPFFWRCFLTYKTQKRTLRLWTKMRTQCSPCENALNMWAIPNSYPYVFHVLYVHYADAPNSMSANAPLKLEAWAPSVPHTNTLMTILSSANSARSDLADWSFSSETHFILDEVKWVWMKLDFQWIAAQVAQYFCRICSRNIQGNLLYASIFDPFFRADNSCWWRCSTISPSCA